MSDNLAASVRQKLLNISRAQKTDFNLLLTHYAIERLLYRLSQSDVRDRFLLKGAMLFSLWTGQHHRPTRDLDLYGRGNRNPEELCEIFQSLCTLSVPPDGLTWDRNSVRVSEIREAEEYAGQRIHLLAHLEKARITIQIDIGFGDVVTPGPVDVEYPTLLNFPAPRLQIYPKETVVAEKLHAMVILGIANSRMKDFYDLWFMAQTFTFAGQALVDAITATFDRRKTLIPEVAPVALSVEFIQHPQKVQQWKAFLARNDLDLGGTTFEEVINTLNTFLVPAISATATKSVFSADWSPVDGWKGSR